MLTYPKGSPRDGRCDTENGPRWTRGGKCKAKKKRRKKKTKPLTDCTSAEKTAGENGHARKEARTVASSRRGVAHSGSRKRASRQNQRAIDMGQDIDTSKGRRADASNQTVGTNASASSGEIFAVDDGNVRDNLVVRIPQATPSPPSSSSRSPTASLVHARIVQNLAIAMDASDLLAASVGDDGFEATEVEPEAELEDNGRCEDYEHGVEKERGRANSYPTPPPPPPAAAAPATSPAAAPRPPPQASQSPRSLPQSGPSAEDLREESAMLSKIAAFVPPAEDVAYRSSAQPPDEWENDSDDGFLSVPVSLSNFC